MQGLEIAVLLGAAVLIGAFFAPRLKVAVPPALLVIGLLLGFVPALRTIELPSETVLLLFLPALLFWESLTTSLRSVRRDLRGIVLLSTLLPVATAFAVAWAATALGMDWASALILGAAVAPPDATAVGALGRSLPRRNFMVLKAESLTNDGAALVLYAIAVGSATGETYTPLTITGTVLLSYFGGIAAGLATAAAAYFALRRVSDGLLINLTLLVTPFAAFLLAEAVGASGALTVVVTGLALAFTSDRITTAASRRMTEDFWPVGTTMLNGALFVLIGLQIQEVVRVTGFERIGQLLLIVVAVWIVLLVVRFVFQMAVVSVIRLLDRRPSQQRRRMRHSARVVSSVAGFRGAVSLALALSVPDSLAEGTLGGRNAIVFVAGGVILLTLLVQGPALPAVVRWARLPADTSAETETRLAEEELTAAATASLDGLAQEQHVTPEVRENVRREVQAAADSVQARQIEQPGELEQQTLDRTAQDLRLRLAVVARKREVLLRLRRNGTVDDQVARDLQRRLDLEELRLTGVGSVD